MLSRNADNLFWMARYMERAENLARLLEVGHRLSIMPASADGSEWASTLSIAGCHQAFDEAYEEITGSNVIEFIGIRNDHPFSIPTCLESARNNGRSVRSLLTATMWQSLNATWLDLHSRSHTAESGAGILDYLDWVKDRTTQFSGATTSTMLRNDAYFFVMLGMLLERADNTARLLDVKYHILLPDHETVGGTLDYYQWSALLRAVTANRAYHNLYSSSLQPWRVAEMLILRAEVPRSLLSCLVGLTEYLERLSDMYGQRKECLRMARSLHADLAYQPAEDIFQMGLHEFLTEFIRRNNQLGRQIQRDYLV